MDAFSEIGVFVRVVEARSFTRAATAVGLTTSGVSRVIGRLEARLGVRLLDRTTRSLGLTADGAAYHERCVRILRDLEDADGALARSRGAPRGRLRVDAPTVLGRFVVGPSMRRFLDLHHELSVDLSVRDHLIDPIAEGVDVVLRMAELRESEMVHKRLGEVRFLLVASPAYLARRGRPGSLADLRKHDLMGFLSGSTPIPWRFRSHGRDLTFSPSARLNTNSVDALREAALGGHGLTQLTEMHVRDDLARGALEVVLGEDEQHVVPIHALFTRDKASLPKVRVFLDFLEERLGRRRGGRSRSTTRG